MKSLALASLLVALGNPAMSANCERRDALRVTVTQVAGNPDAYMNKCVLIDGVMYGHSLFETVDGVYVRSPDALDDTKSGLRLGVDGARARARPGYRHVTLLGRIQDCEVIRQCVEAAAGPDEVVMVGGFCHTAYGPFVSIEDLEFHGGAPFFRQMGDAHPANYGDIEPVPANWPHRAKIEALAGKFLAALRARDRHTLADIHFRNVGLEWPDDEAQMLHFLLDDPKSPFAALRTSTNAPQTVVLSYRQPDEGEDDFSAFVCFCREPDCTDRWPIASFDADNVAGRPYACTTIEPYLSDGHDIPHFRTPAMKAGLVEPTRRAR